MTLKLTEVQLNNLMLFLERVNLNGSEVPAYVDIVNIINNAEVEAPNNKQDKTKEDEI